MESTSPGHAFQFTSLQFEPVRGNTGNQPPLLSPLVRSDIGEHLPRPSTSVSFVHCSIDKHFPQHLSLVYDIKVPWLYSRKAVGLLHCMTECERFCQWTENEQTRSIIQNSETRTLILRCVVASLVSQLHLGCPIR